MENATLCFTTSIETASHVLVLLTGGLLQQGSTIEAELNKAVKQKHKKLVFVYSSEHGWDFGKFYARPESEAKAVIANHEALVFRAKGKKYEKCAVALEVLRRMPLT